MDRHGDRRKMWTLKSIYLKGIKFCEFHFASFGRFHKNKFPQKLIPLRYARKM